MTGKRPMRFLAILGMAAVLLGCATIESNRAGAPFRDVNGAVKNTHFAGTYSLPRRHLRFEILGNSNFMHSSTKFDVARDASADILAPDPDPSFRYEINYIPSRFSKDEIDFKIEDQVLRSVTVATDDQSGTALINLAEALGRITRLSGGLNTGTPGSSARDTDAKPDKTVGIIRLDPTDPASLHRARARLKGHIEIDVYPPPRPIRRIPACDFAICFRPLTSVTVSFYDRHSGNVKEFVTSVPDPHQISGLDIERSPFVKRDTVLTFADGSLTSVDLTKPSEVAAAALLPIQVVDAVFTGVNDAITSLIGLEKNELQAQTDLLNAQANFLKALSAYRDTYSDTFPETAARASGEDSPDITTGGRAGTPEDEVDDTEDSPDIPTEG